MTDWQALRHYCGGLVVRDYDIDEGLNCTNCGKKFMSVDVPDAFDVAALGWDPAPVLFVKEAKEVPDG